VAELEEHARALLPELVNGSYLAEMPDGV